MIVVFSDRDGYQRPPRKGDTMGFGIYLCLTKAAEPQAAQARPAARPAISSSGTMRHPRSNRAG